MLCRYGSTEHTTDYSGMPTKSEISPDYGRVGVVDGGSVEYDDLTCPSDGDGASVYSTMPSRPL
jgi:hypothetical protein